MGRCREKGPVRYSSRWDGFSFGPSDRTTAQWRIARRCSFSGNSLRAIEVRTGGQNRRSVRQVHRRTVPRRIACCICPDARRSIHWAADSPRTLAIQNRPRRRYHAPIYGKGYGLRERGGKGPPLLVAELSALRIPDTRLSCQVQTMRLPTRKGVTKRCTPSGLRCPALHRFPVWHRPRSFNHFPTGPAAG